MSGKTRSGLVRGRPGPGRLILIAFMTAENAKESCRCPAVVTREIGRHRPSAARWILVENPPRERPRASRSTPERHRLCATSAAAGFV